MNEHYGSTALRIDRDEGVIRVEGLPAPEYELIAVKITADVRYPMVIEGYLPVEYDAGVLCARVPRDIDPNDILEWKSIITPAYEHMRWTDDGGMTA